jgi:hypothetical protein
VRSAAQTFLPQRNTGNATECAAAPAAPFFFGNHGLAQISNI